MEECAAVSDWTNIYNSKQRLNSGWQQEGVREPKLMPGTGFVGYVTALPDENLKTQITQVVTAPEGWDDSQSQKSQPAILKKRNRPACEPIKSLQFSPSRFLNSKSQCEQHCVSTASNTTLAIKVEDSGFETYCETDEMFLNAITSTPIGKKQHKQLPSPLKQMKESVSPVGHRGQFSDSCISLEHDTYSDCFRQIGTTFDSGTENVFKTPLIRRFLNESGPRTPTPFKCESTTSDSHIEPFAYPLNTGTRPFHVSDSCLMPSRWQLQCNDPSLLSRPKSEKRARKALVLDMEISQNELYRKSECKSARLGRSDVGFQSLTSKSPNLAFSHGHLWPRRNIRIRSNLVDNKTVVQCRQRGVGRKSFCTMHHDILNMADDGNSLLELNKKFVAVACGRSEDQKAMTIAAKKCLQFR